MTPSARLYWAPWSHYCVCAELQLASLDAAPAREKQRRDVLPLWKEVARASFEERIKTVRYDWKLFRGQLVATPFPEAERGLRRSDRTRGRRLGHGLALNLFSQTQPVLGGQRDRLSDLLGGLRRDHPLGRGGLVARPVLPAGYGEDHARTLSEAPPGPGPASDGIPGTVRHRGPGRAERDQESHKLPLTAKP